MLKAFVRRVTTEAQRRYVRHLLEYGKLLVWKDPPVRFVIFAQGRTGSTLLIRLLNCHPDILCDGEILNAVSHRKFKYPLLQVKRRSKRAVLKRKKAFGFHVKIYQLTGNQNLSDPGRVLRALHSRGWKVVYLRRRNIVRQQVSSDLARANRTYHVRDGEGRQRRGWEPLKVDCEAMVRKVQWRGSLHAEELAVLDGLPYLEIEYEKDLLRGKRHQATADRIFDYLGLERAPVSADLVRTGKDDLSRLVANYDEFVRALEEVSLDHYVRKVRTEGTSATK